MKSIMVQDEVWNALMHVRLNTKARSMNAVIEALLTRTSPVEALETQEAEEA